MKAFVEKRVTRESQILLTLFCILTLFYLFASIALESQFGFSVTALLEYFQGSELLLIPPPPWNEVIFHLHYRLFMEILFLLLLFGSMALVLVRKIVAILFFVAVAMLLAELLATLGLRWGPNTFWALSKLVLFFGSRLILAALAILTLKQLLWSPKRAV